MQTRFSAEQLADPDVAHSEQILRKCVHCGFCTATCPTYLTLGDELDSPRGRIYLIKEMLENDRPADARTVRHIDRCLSCLACMTTCPSGVNYMHLVDHARVHIEETYRRPLLDRLYRAVLQAVLPYPARFALALRLARLGKPFAGVIRAIPGMRPAAAMLDLAPARLPRGDSAEPAPIDPQRRTGRVALLAGCAQQVLSPQINAATVRLLARLGIEVVHAKGEECCGSLVHHMGRRHAAHEAAKRNIDAWTAEIEGEGLDAIVITASGCGTTIKDYGHVLRDDPAYAEKAAAVSALAVDISEYLASLNLPASNVGRGTTVAYHSACSLQHGQKITAPPKQLLENAGFTVANVAEGHLCCGSAGTYNILQTPIADQLKARKIANLEATGAAVIAAGNIGCITQIASGTGIPVVHTIELLDWAHGGERPAGLA